MVSIIDGNHLACRCFFGVDNSLSTSTGQQTNLIYGFINTVRMFVNRYGIENHLFVVWDSEGKKSRHELYPEYKAGRNKLPQEFFDQMKITQEFIEVLNIPQFKVQSTEADDIIGTLTYKSRKKGQKVLIISSDHDFEQLITQHVKVLSPSLSKSKEYIKDYDYVLAEYDGIEPKQLTELLALTGDASDNIFGLEKVGPKTAAKLLKANGSLDNIISNVDVLKTLNKSGEIQDAKDDMKEKVRKNIDLLRLNKHLVTINCYIEGVEPKFSRNDKIDLNKLKSMFEQFEFKSFLREIEQWKMVFDGSCES